MAMLCEAAQLNGTDVTEKLLSCGVIDMVVAALSAAEEVGTDNCNGCVVVVGVMWILKSVTTEGKGLGRIEDKIRAIPSALRYVKDSNLSNFVDFGMTAGVYGTIVAANLFGKDEENEFGFARECQHCVCSRPHATDSLRVLHRGRH